MKTFASFVTDFDWCSYCDYIGCCFLWPFKGS